MAFRLSLELTFTALHPSFLSPSWQGIKPGVSRERPRGVFLSLIQDDQSLDAIANHDHVDAVGELVLHTLQTAAHAIRQD